eukprot:GILJ01001180.1.p1 GENE.GILJ01001180.1~~GILJ01001180.1.p1  ORF type:complete len:202 (-),score=16.04 GILJ01001180.1:272-835(-)
MDLESMREGALGQFIKQWNELQEEKTRKLREQKMLASELNKLVRTSQEHSRLVRKSLEAAITISKRPGFIEYTEFPPENVTEYRRLIDRIEKVESEIKMLEAQIKEMEAKKKRDEENAAHGKTGMILTSLAQWLEQNGSPRGTQQGMMSKFDPERRLVGGAQSKDGTIRFPATKSKSVTLVRGKLIR